MTTLGTKFDQGKDRWELLPTDAVRQIVKVLTHGAVKYTPEQDWTNGILYSRCYAAAIRHLVAWWEGEENDSEWGLSHLAHAACCILFLLTYRIRGMSDGIDDRPKLDVH